jgi:hypothetical protein
VTGAGWAAPTGSPVDVASVRGGWRIGWRGRVWTDADIRGEHLAFVALLTGDDSWRMLDVADVRPEVGPVRLMCLIAALVAVDDAVSDETELAEIIVRVRATPVAELLDALSVD